MNFTVANVEPPAAAGAVTPVKVSGTTITFVVAVLGIIPGLVTACVDAVLTKPIQREIQLADNELKRRQAEAEWLRLALSIEDSKARKTAMEYLSSAGLVRDDKGRLKALDPPRLVSPAAAGGCSATPAASK